MFDITVHEKRRERLRGRMRDKGLSAMLVSHGPNRFYLSGFELFDPQCNETSGYLLVTAASDDWIFTDSRYLDEARRIWNRNNIFVYSHPRLTQIAERVRDLAGGRVGFESQALPHSVWSELSRTVDMEPADGLVGKLRLVKEPREIERMRASAALNHRVFEAAERLAEPGRTEAEVAWLLEQEFRNAGAQALSFSTIAAVGENAALPHASPGGTRLEEGRMLLVDMGCRLDDYCSDQTRTFWIGDSPSSRFLKVRDLVRRAQDAAIAVIRPGLDAADAYRAAWKVFEEAGMQDNFTHALGHGIGLETHEPPSVSTRSDTVLEQGMVITVEPGLYWPDWGGVRWEFMVHVTSNGCEIL
jgi:Xaa-Pro aminopeptidase